MEASKRDLLIKEQSRQMKAHEMTVGASSSRIADVEISTTEGANIVVDITCVPTTREAGFGKL